MASKKDAKDAPKKEELVTEAPLSMLDEDDDFEEFEDGGDRIPTTPIPA